MMLPLFNLTDQANCFINVCLNDINIDIKVKIMGVSHNLSWCEAEVTKVEISASFLPFSSSYLWDWYLAMSGERERESESERRREIERMRIVCVCMSVRMRDRVCECVRGREKERERESKIMSFNFARSIISVFSAFLWISFFCQLQKFSTDRIENVQLWTFFRRQVFFLASKRISLKFRYFLSFDEIVVQFFSPFVKYRRNSPLLQCFCLMLRHWINKNGNLNLFSQVFWKSQSIKLDT